MFAIGEREAENYLHILTILDPSGSISNLNLIHSLSNQNCGFFSGHSITFKFEKVNS
jgi:hypothetical protein